MQANWQEIAKAFDEEKDFVLATIIETRGATYQKAGAMMLVDKEGSCYGLLSGGCLEADISLHAKQVFLHNQSKIISYDLSVDADLLWGLGLGCDGAIDILLQPLLISNNHLGFNRLISHISKQKSGYFVQKIPVDKETYSIPFAEFILSEHIDYSKIWPVTKYVEHNPSCLITPINPPISILICGAGPDVVPVAKFADQMGWKISLWDHRQNHLDEDDFTNYQRHCVRAKNTIVEDYIEFDAVIIMTHNLAMDGEYLSKLTALPTDNLSYIGLLGPQSRRDKLLENCDIDLLQLKRRVHGPIGLNLGGRGAESIALSIVSEIQQHFFTYTNSKQNSEQSIICAVNDAEVIKSLDKIKQISNNVNYA